MKEKQEIIDKYIAGELSKEEEKKLRDNILLDKELKQEIELIDELQEVILFEQQHKPKEIRLQQTLNNIEEDYFAESSTKKIVPLKKSRKWLVAASLVLLVALPIFIGKSFFNKQQLVATNYIMPSTNNRTTAAEWKNLALDAKTPQYLFYQYQLSDFLYKNKQLEQLQQIYKILLDNEQNPTYNTKEINFELVKWNSLLVNMLLKEEDTDSAIEELLQSDISSKYKEKAIQLQQKRNSLLYQLFN